MTTVQKPIAQKPVDWPRRTRRALIYLVLVGFTILFLVPVYMLLVTSFKSIDQVSLSTMWNFPTAFTTESFTRAFDELTAGCNGCHQTLDHAYIRIQRPARFPYSDQAVAPEK